MFQRFKVSGFCFAELAFGSVQSCFASRACGFEKLLNGSLEKELNSETLKP
jgi:hypothetical protein